MIDENQGPRLFPLYIQFSITNYIYTCTQKYHIQITLYNQSKNTNRNQVRQ